MTNSEPMKCSITDFREIAEQVKVELAIFLGIEQSLRIALQWMTRNHGNRHKLSTLRFHTWSFERNLSRIQILADYGGYMHRITDANPHLAREVDMLRNERAELHANLERIIVRLDQMSGDDSDRFGQACVDLERFLDELTAHGQRETALLQHSFAQEEGGSG